LDNVLKFDTAAFFYFEVQYVIPQIQGSGVVRFTLLHIAG